MFPFLLVVLSFALNGALNNRNVRMYVPANQTPDFHCNVNDSPQKLTVLVGLYGNGNTAKKYHNFT